jgi:hypothetical protein
MALTEGQLRGRRLAAQMLAGTPGRSAEHVARRLLGVQAQNLRSARLGVRARTRGLGISDVHRAIEDRDVVITWLMRGTLHLVCREDVWWLHGLSAPTLRQGCARRLDMEGLPLPQAGQAVADVESMLADGPLTRAQIAQELAARGTHVPPTALVHVLVLATLDGLIVRGPLQGPQQRFVSTDQWLEERPPTELAGERRESALAELARRYLAGHGPARDVDLSYWSGLPLRDARSGLRAIGSDLDELGDGLVALRSASDRAPAARPPKLLPSFDPYLVGWKGYTHAMPAERVGDVARGGMIGAIAMVDGGAVGTWTAHRKGSSANVQVDLWQEVGSAERDALEAEATDVDRFERS